MLQSLQKQLNIQQFRCFSHGHDMVKDLVDRSNEFILLQALDLKPYFTWETSQTDFDEKQFVSRNELECLKTLSRSQI